jgi:hypothetical protein
MISAAFLRLRHGDGRELLRHLLLRAAAAFGA